MRRGRDGGCDRADDILTEALSGQHDEDEMSTETPHRYTAELADQIEVAWQDRWLEEGTFRAPNPAGTISTS